MPVDTLHASYTAATTRWQRARDTFGGSDDVKKSGPAYLPLLEGHYGLVNQDQLYNAYKMRALFYPAVKRTAIGLLGLVFGKKLTVQKAPVNFEPMFEDVTRSGVSLDIYAMQLCLETLLVGRVGTLIDAPVDGGEPYVALYMAENIVNWRTSRIGGRQVLTLVVLKEIVETYDDDEFKAECKTQYRVLRLQNNVYTQQVYTPDPQKSGAFTEGPLIVPRRRLEALTYIPFCFLGPTSVDPDVEHAPLEDLVDVNLSHYRTSADHEHGAHFVALPTPWISGHSTQVDDKGQPTDPITLGPGNVLMLSKDATVGMLEFSGAGLASLKDLKEEKRQQMITLGARMLETQKLAQEAAETVKLRHAGERSALTTLAEMIGLHLTYIVRWWLWWEGLDIAAADKLKVTVNPEIMEQVTPDDVRMLVDSWQKNVISKRTVYYNMEYGEWTRPGISFEQEEAEIKKEAATKEPLEDPAPPVPGAAAA